ncbi:MAG TPA: GNAT family N-acetyltransferase [Galbitalea sp.]|jgi:predicted acetyltransferase|nr:GNAT family N-acetyltransferase [Galbitalea sp.]
MSDEVLATPIDAIAAADLAGKGLRFETILSSDDAFEPWFQAMTRGFHESAFNLDSLPNRVEGFADRRICGVWDDTLADAPTPVATASSWAMPLTVPGRRTVPSWAISTITVAPTHRRRGIARDLLEAELRTAAALNVPVAILTASEATIYERFGFAPAALAADWVIDPRRAKWTGRVPAGRVQLVSRGQARDEGGFEVFERSILEIPGQVGVSGHLWQRLFGLPDSPDVAGIRVARYDDVDGAPQGFAIYRAASENFSTIIRVTQLFAATDDAYAALWQYLFELDLITSVVANLRSTDEAFRWQISDSRAAREDHAGDHLWLRILDVKTTLEARHYSAPGTFVLEVSDDLGFADGSWLLSIDNAGSAKAQKLDDTEGFADNHRLRLSVNELAAVYLGATTFATLIRAGRVNEKTPLAARAADAAFRSDVTPWLSLWF